MIDFDFKRKLPCYSTFETGRVIVLELMEGMFGTVAIDPVFSGTSTITFLLFLMLKFFISLLRFLASCPMLV